MTEIHTTLDIDIKSFVFFSVIKKYFYFMITLQKCSFIHYFPHKIHNFNYCTLGVNGFFFCVFRKITCEHVCSWIDLSNSFCTSFRTSYHPHMLLVKLSSETFQFEQDNRKWNLFDTIFKFKGHPTNTVVRYTLLHSLSNKPKL